MTGLNRVLKKLVGVGVVGRCLVERGVVLREVVVLTVGTEKRVVVVVFRGVV